MVLASILPVVLGPGVALSCYHRRSHKKEELFIGDCSDGLPRLFFYILDNINILGDHLYFKVTALNFIMQRMEVKDMATFAPRLEVGKKHLWCDVGVKRLSASDFLHPRILDSVEDKLCRISPNRLVSDAVGVLGLVRRFCARADDGRGIIINCRIVGANTCGFGELCTIARCVRCHLPDEANEVLFAPRFVI